MKKFLLDILTPERTFYHGEVEGIVVQAVDGQQEILANHMPVVIGLQPSMLKIIENEEIRICANGEGFVMVENDFVCVLCQTMEWPEEIDYDRVNRAIAEHTLKLKDAKNPVDAEVSKMTIARAMARLKVKMLKDGRV